MTQTQIRAQIVAHLEALAAEATKWQDTPAAFVRPRRLQLVVVNSAWTGQGWEYRARVSEYNHEGDVVGEMVTSWTGPNWKHRRTSVEARARRETTDAALFAAVQ